MIPEDIRKTVKSRYNKFAETGGNRDSCWPSKQQPSSGFAVDQGLYTDESLSSIPEIARNLSRGCGNPIGYATLHAGDVVVDFGCGGGIDVILAAQKVGPQGKVVGIDFASQMIDQAKHAIIAAGLKDYSIELLEAELGDSQLPSSFSDVVISNCVINLCPEKDNVY